MSTTTRRLHYTYAQYVALEEERSALLGPQLPRGCRTFTSDLRIRIPAGGLSTYPDVAVVCGRTERAAEDVLAVTNPVLLVDITSDSTEEYDRGEKLRHYTQLPSVREILIVSHREPRLTLHQRTDTDWISVEHGAGRRSHFPV